MALAVGGRARRCRAPARRPSSTPRRVGSGTRQTVSPLVDIQGRIVDRSDLEAFTVLADGKSYWRLTALDEFDGRLWTSERGYGDADGELDGGLPQQLTVPLNQEFTIQALDAIWLPAAYAPERIDISDSVRYDDETASLVTRRNEVQPGTTYGVVSRVPVLDRPSSSGPSSHPRPAIAESYLDLPRLPRHLPPAGRRHRRSGSDARTRRPSCSRTGSSGTSPTTWPSPGATRPTPSPTSSRSGGATASSSPAPTRPWPAALGLPARVAVGFTPGELRSDGRYHVLGKHAHAWPEVYLTGVGWVPFEPTPGRGLPGAEAYTGVPAAQEGEAPQAPAIDRCTGNHPARLGHDGALRRHRAPAAPRPWLQRSARRARPGQHELATAHPRRRSWCSRCWRGLWLLIAPRIARARWDRRRRAAQTGSEQVLVSWREATDVLARGGTPAQASETPLEFADRLTDTRDADADLVHRMADNVTVAAYARDDVDDDIVGATDDARRELEHRRWARAGWRDKLRWLADPRPVLRRKLPGDDDSVEEREPVEAR